MNNLVYSTRTGNPNHAAMVEIMAKAAWLATVEPVAGPACVTEFPEPHGRGEFPMSCYSCNAYENY